MRIENFKPFNSEKRSLPQFVKELYHVFFGHDLLRCFLESVKEVV